MAWALCRNLTLLSFLICPTVSPADYTDPNVFAHTFNMWTHQMQADHLISVRELEAWENTKKAWPKFEKEIDRYYGLR
jgi:hypothetical protein